MTCKPYEWVRELYLKHLLPKVLEHMDSKGRVLDPSGVPIKENPEQPQENPYIDGLLIFYDGDKLLGKVEKLLTRKQAVEYEENVDTLDRFVDHIMRTGFGDRTRFYNSHTGKIGVAQGAVRNAYDGIDETDLIEKNVPYDFMSPDGTTPKDSMGTRTAAALVTTKKYDGVDPASEGHPIRAVILKTSEYEVGGKVVHMAQGRVVEECFARYNAEKKNIEIVDWRYDSNGVRYETITDYVKPLQKAA